MASSTLPPEDNPLEDGERECRTATESLNLTFLLPEDLPEQPEGGEPFEDTGEDMDSLFSRSMEFNLDVAAAALFCRGVVTSST